MTSWAGSRPAVRSRNTPCPSKRRGSDFGPEQLVVDNGSLYVTVNNGRSIVRISPADPGHPVIVREAQDWNWPDSIAPGTNGALWFSTWPNDDLKRLNADGTEQTFVTDGVDTNRSGAFAAGPGGSVWYTDGSNETTYIREITGDGRSGSVAVRLVGAGASITSMAYDGHRAMWFTEFTSNSAPFVSVGGGVGWVDGHLRAHVLDLHGDYLPHSITPGPDGAMWFAEKHGLGRISAGGQVTHYSLAPYQADEIAFGPDKALWLIDSGANRIGRLTLTPPLRLTVARQHVGAVATRRGLQARCRLPVAGRCTVSVQVSSKRARKLKLKVAKGATTVTIGTGTKAAKRASRLKVSVRLSAKARKAMAKARGAVTVTVIASAAAPGSLPSQARKTIKLRR